ncbi:MAG: hypothetical protein ACYTFG_08480 [Planctomycetota bacterium]|jgi:hypothetical protein
MRNCEICSKKLYEGKHRQVVVQGETTVLCGECGRIDFLAPNGEQAAGVVQAVNFPVREKLKGRNITFHAQRPLIRGDVIKEAKFTNLPKATGLPSTYKVLGARPLIGTEIVESGEGDKKKTRKKKKVLGYAVRAFSH